MPIVIIGPQCESGRRFRTLRTFIEKRVHTWEHYSSLESTFFSLDLLELPSSIFRVSQVLKSIMLHRAQFQVGGDERRTGKVAYPGDDIALSVMSPIWSIPILDRKGKLEDEWPAADVFDGASTCACFRASHGTATPYTLYTALGLDAASPRLARHWCKRSLPRKEWNVYAGGWLLQRPRPLTYDLVMSGH